MIRLSEKMLLKPLQKWVILRELNPKERRMVAKLWTEIKVGR